MDRTDPERAFDYEVGFRVDKKKLGEIIDRCIQKHGFTISAEVLDSIKAQGYKFSTRSGMTISIADMVVPEAKKEKIAETEKKVLAIEKQYRRGLITNDERYRMVVAEWERTTGEVAKALMDNLDEFNPINIMGYADKDLLWILDQVNEIHPYQFSIVDTFGSMRRRDLERIVSLVDHNLAPDIRVGLHLHENMALSFCLAQEFLDKHLGRDTTVDGSLMGMGRIPGNLPIELIADYMNEYFGGHYNIDDLMDAIQDHIAPIKGNCAWGYTPAYFLSAKFNLHRNYAEHYLGKGDLTNRDINHILAAIAPNKKTVFDAAYADTLYTEYKNRRIDDAGALAALQRAFAGKTVLVLAPGGSLAAEAGRAAVAAAQADVTVSANFVPDFVTPDYAFFTNAKRFDVDAAYPCPLILTSNLRADKDAAVVNYDRLSATDAQGGNSVLMLLRLLRQCGAARVLLAGADGYRPGTAAYADEGLHTHTGRGAAYNAQMAGAIRAAGLAPIETPVRGGTDGATLSYMGLPCPNLGTGGFNFHGVCECTTVERMDRCTEIVLNIISLYAE
mgnify:CR=1 FL=1